MWSTSSSWAASLLRALNSRSDPNHCIMLKHCPCRSNHCDLSTIYVSKTLYGKRTREKPTPAKGLWHKCQLYGNSRSVLWLARLRQLRQLRNGWKSKWCCSLWCSSLKYSSSQRCWLHIAEKIIIIATHLMSRGGNSGPSEKNDTHCKNFCARGGAARQLHWSGWGKMCCCCLGCWRL